MDIKIFRTKDENKLTFTIVCENPKEFPKEDGDFELMGILDDCSFKVQNSIQPNDVVKETILSRLFDIKEMVFEDIEQSLSFSIREVLEPRFKHISREIYNWQYDNAEAYLKKILQTFDPQRTTYYFDNDQSEEVSEDKNETLGPIDEFTTGIYE